MTSTADESTEDQGRSDENRPVCEYGDLALLATDITLDYSVRIARDEKSRGLFSSAGERGVVHAVRGVSLAARQGEFIGLVGRNGSGKSALLRVLAGVEAPTPVKSSPPPSPSSWASGPLSCPTSRAWTTSASACSPWG